MYIVCNPFVRSRYIGPAASDTTRHCRHRFGHWPACACVFTYVTVYTIILLYAQYTYTTYIDIV